MVVELQLSLLDPSLIQLVKDPGRFSDSKLAFQLRRYMGVLEGNDLGLEFVELPQCLLFMDGILVIESRLLPVTI